MPARRRNQSAPAAASTEAEGAVVDGPGSGSDTDLLVRLRSRDERALDDLLARFGRALTRTAWLVLGDGQAADDAVQQTLIAAWDGARRTGDDTPARAWLFGILMNVCRKWQRSVGRRRRHEEAAAAGRPEVRDADGPTTDEELALERMRRALAGLSPPLREVVVLRFQQGLSVEETADVLNLAVGTVKSRTHSAVADLRRRLGAPE